MSSSVLTQTALSFLSGFTTLTPDPFLSGFTTLTPDPFLSILSPNAILTLPPKNSTTFASHITTLRQVLLGFPVTPKEIIENETKRQVTVWATSLARFRDEAMDEGLSDEEWGYGGGDIVLFSRWMRVGRGLLGSWSLWIVRGRSG